MTPIQTIPWARQLDFLEEIRSKGVKAFLIGVRIKQPRGRRDTTQERIAVLWGETKACDLMPIAYGERRDRYHRLVEQTSKIAMIAPEGKNRTRHDFMGQGHIGICRQFLDNVIEGYGALHTEVEPDTVHILGIELNHGRKQIQVEAARLEEMPGIAGVVGTKLCILMGADLGRRNKTLLLTDITRTPHTDKTPFKEIIGRLVVQGQGLQLGQLDYEYCN